MSRPSTVPIDVQNANWVSRLNSNFQKMFDLPFSIFFPADTTELNTYHPGLYAGCLAIVQTNYRLYKSNGTSWVKYDTVLNYIADLNTGSAALADVRNAYNSLLGDMRTKGMMASS